MSALSIQTACSALTEVKQHALAEQDALPQGFPAVIKGNAPWVGSDFVNDETFVYNLTEFEVSEICQSLDTFKGKYSNPHLGCFCTCCGTVIPLCLSFTSEPLRRRFFSHALVPVIASDPGLDDADQSAILVQRNQG